MSFDPSKTSIPSMTSLPELWFSSPLKQRISVDLPDPDGPQITTRSPWRTVMLMSLSA